MDGLRALAVKILEADCAGGSDAQKIAMLVGTFTPEDLATIPGRWIAENGQALSWDDNLLDLAERVMGLPTKPLDPASPEMRDYLRQVAGILRRAETGAAAR